MKKLKEIARDILKNLESTLEKKIGMLGFELFDELEVFEKNLMSSLTGNEAAAKRARVSSIKLEKKMKEYRKLSMTRKKKAKKEKNEN